MCRGNRFCRNIVLSRLRRYPHWWAHESVQSQGSLYWFTQPNVDPGEAFERCDENIFWYPKATGLRVDIHLPLPHKDNVWMHNVSFEDWRREFGHDARSVVADPGFANVDAGDFGLDPGSPPLALGFPPMAVECIGIRR